ncbi:hypothetical protein B0H17DRAFT_1132330 [Mycena rosella]|uniref:Uncharacterized protein n=1 Tax=Mycena rosella TaxID=1033263 RepID=A0AAD7DMU7_MYCRO|nr:hypothetical protein B0H17DRAFT_1132330 [Mycena rosella]
MRMRLVSKTYIDKSVEEGSAGVRATSRHQVSAAPRWPRQGCSGVVHRADVKPMFASTKQFPYSGGGTLVTECQDPRAPHDGIKNCLQQTLALVGNRNNGLLNPDRTPSTALTGEKQNKKEVSGGFGQVVRNEAKQVFGFICCEQISASCVERREVIVWFLFVPCGWVYGDSNFGDLIFREGDLTFSKVTFELYSEVLVARREKGY